MIIDAIAGGVECSARLTYYQAGDPGKAYGPPEECWPPEPMELEFDLLDEDGQVSAYLHSILTDEEEETIADNFIAAIEEERALAREGGHE